MHVYAWIVWQTERAIPKYPLDFVGGIAIYTIKFLHLQQYFFENYLLHLNSIWTHPLSWFDFYAKACAKCFTMEILPFSSSFSTTSLSNLQKYSKRMQCMFWSICVCKSWCNFLQIIIKRMHYDREMNALRKKLYLM